MDHAREPGHSKPSTDGEREHAPAEEPARPLPDGLKRHYGLGGAGDAFSRAMEGGRAPLPHQSEMQRSFGFDLSGVRASLGRQRELIPLGAKAAARGDEVAFASRSPSRDEVAHELVHVGQARGAQARGVVQALSTVGSDGSAAEREAETLGARATSGERVQVRETPGAGIHLIGDEALAALLKRYSGGNDELREQLAEKFAAYCGKRDLEKVSEFEADQVIAGYVHQLKQAAQQKPREERKVEEKKREEPKREEKKREERKLEERKREEPKLEERKTRRQKEPELSIASPLPEKKITVEEEPKPIPKEITSVEDVAHIIVKYAEDFPDAIPEFKEAVAKAIEEGGGKAERGHVICDVLVPVQDRWNKRLWAKKHEEARKRGEPGLYRNQDLSVHAQLVEGAEKSITSWSESTKVAPAEGAADSKSADRYLDLLQSGIPEGANDGIYENHRGLKGSDVTSNCSLTSMVPMLGCKSSTIPFWLGDKRKSQDTGTLQPRGEEGLKGGTGSQLDGMKAFAARVVSPHLTIEDPQMQKNGTRGALAVADGIAVMRGYPVGTQFVCLLTFPGGHYVYAERRGEDEVKFQDWQPVVDTTKHENQSSTIAPLAQKRPTETSNQASPVPFVKEPEAYQCITFLAFVPDKALIDQVIGDGHGGAHDAIRGRAQKKKDRK